MTQAEFLKVAYVLGMQRALSESSDVNDFEKEAIFKWLGRALGRGASAGEQALKDMPEAMKAQTAAGRNMLAAEGATAKEISQTARQAAQPIQQQVNQAHEMALQQGQRAAPQATQAAPQATQATQAAPQAQQAATQAAPQAEQAAQQQLQQYAPQAQQMQAAYANPNATEAASALQAVPQEAQQAIRSAGSNWWQTPAMIAAPAAIGYAADGQQGAMMGAGIGLGARLGMGGTLGRMADAKGIGRVMEAAGQKMTPEAYSAMFNQMVGTGLGRNVALGLGLGAAGGVGGYYAGQATKPKESWTSNLGLGATAQSMLQAAPGLAQQYMALDPALQGQMGQMGMGAGQPQVSQDPNLMAMPSDPGTMGLTPEQQMLVDQYYRQGV